MRKGGAREYFISQRFEEEMPQDFMESERIQEIMEQHMAMGEPPDVDMIRDSLRFGGGLQHPERRWGFNQHERGNQEQGRHSWRSMVRQQIQMQAQQDFFSQVWSEHRRRKIKTKNRDDFIPRYEELLSKYDPISHQNPFSNSGISFFQQQGYSKRLKQQNQPEQDDSRKPSEIFNYSLYETRLASFKNWPHKNYAPHYIEEMAMSGFYLDANPENPDRCVCFYCGKVLLQWEEKDDPVEDHLKHSPNCKYALKFKVGGQIMQEKGYRRSALRQFWKL